MKKLRLDLDALEVEEFDPAAPETDDGKGTVFANSLNPNCGYTAVGGPCMDSGNPCVPWSDPYYCGETYMCNTATDCSFANTACCWVIT
jgi:hypothetical protein